MLVPASYVERENRRMDIEAWKRRLEGGEPEEWCPDLQCGNDRIQDSCPSMRRQFLN